MPFLTQGKTNWKYILIVVILAVIVSGGILGWRWRVKQEAKIPEEITPPKEKPIVEEAPFNLTTTKLATIPENADFIAFSPDGRRVAYTVGWSMVIDGKKGKDYDWLSPEGSPIFSPDSKKVAYIGWEGGKARLVVNEEESEVYDDIYGRPVFSPDSQKIAYIAQKEIAQWEVKMFAIVNGEKSEPYDHIEDEDLIFSPDSKRLAYTATEEDKEKPKVIVIGEKEEKIYEGCNKPISSPDSQKLACIGINEKGKRFIMINGKGQENYYDIIFRELVFSPDSKRFAYVAGTLQPLEKFVVVDGKKGKPHDDIYFLTFSPDSQKIAYMAKKGEERFIVINDEEIKTHEWDEDYLFEQLPILHYYFGYSLSPIVFSPDSQKIAYIAKKEDKLTAVVNGKEGKPYNIITPPVFSPDGQKIAYAAGEGEEMLEKMFVVINDKESKAYDWIFGKLVFSPDGKYLAYGTQLGNELWWIVEEVE